MTIINIEAAGATEALPQILHHILTDGEEVGSRQGERTVEILHPRIVLTKPWQREILSGPRRASITAQIAETMWVLAGRNDVEWLQRYLPRAKEFSDDGTTWRGGYGPRIRGWEGAQTKISGTGRKETYGIFHTDQLAHVVNLLKSDRSTRRAVINIYDPAVDSAPGKDVPCNNWLHFISRNGHLDLHVATRSNDAIWGWSGINAFEWSALLEVVAGLTGNLMGKVVYSISSLHIYEKHWNKAHSITDAAAFIGTANDSPRFSPIVREVSYFDDLVKEWFVAEEQIRTGRGYDIESFPEPMLRSWLRVVAWRWTKHRAYLEPLNGTRLYAGVLLSYEYSQGGDSATRRYVDREQNYFVETADTGDKVYEALTSGADLFMLKGSPKVGETVTVTPVKVSTPFCGFVDNLHREKDAVYGDSWKKRGEQIGILANIARKVDRLGEAGGGDTAADTVIDLLVYLVKYRLWMVEAFDAPAYFGHPGSFDDHVDSVSAVLHRLDQAAGANQVAPPSHHPVQISALRGRFARLEEVVVEDPAGEIPRKRALIVDAMLPIAFSLAKSLWAQEGAQEVVNLEAWRTESGSEKYLRSGYGQE